jgi:hypothetical protein
MQLGDFQQYKTNYGMLNYLSMFYQEYKTEVERVYIQILFVLLKYYQFIENSELSNHTLLFLEENIYKTYNDKYFDEFIIPIKATVLFNLSIIAGGNFDNQKGKELFFENLQKLSECLDNNQKKELLDLVNRRKEKNILKQILDWSHTKLKLPEFTREQNVLVMTAFADFCDMLDKHYELSKDEVSRRELNQIYTVVTKVIFTLQEE